MKCFELRWAEIAGLPDRGRVLVRWTAADSVRALHGGRVFEPYDEMVPIADLVPCDPAGPRHPATLPVVGLVVGDEVDLESPAPAEERRHGRIVGLYRDRFIVEWTEIDSPRALSAESSDVPVRLPLYEVNTPAVLRLCYRGTRHPGMREDSGEVLS